MQQQKIVSREYKIMLRPKLFTGAEKALLAHAHALWRDVAEKVGPVAFDAAGDLSHIKTRRLITFHDTPKRRLNDARYIFRERQAENRSGREITLKFRHPDRFLAQARKMQAKASDAKTKFEEDIKAPFVSMYSFSTTVTIDIEAAFTKLRDVSRLFPDLAKRLDDADDAEPLRAVNNFTAREIVIDGATMQIGKTPNVDAEWALIVWYNAHGEGGKPVARGRGQPHLSLEYDSHDGPSVYGVGWKIPADFVERRLTTSVKSPDGSVHPQFWFTRLGMSGILVPIAVGRYRLGVQDRYLSFVLVSGEAGHEYKWQVTDAEGRIFSGFDFSVNPCSDAPDSFCVRWYLTQVKDVDGNIAKFVYFSESSSASLLLKQIFYNNYDATNTGHKYRFFLVLITSCRHGECCKYPEVAACFGYFLA